jgi:hypothetical protein
MHIGWKNRWSVCLKSLHIYTDSRDGKDLKGKISESGRKMIERYGLHAKRIIYKYNFFISKMEMNLWLRRYTKYFGNI